MKEISIKIVCLMSVIGLMLIATRALADRRVALVIGNADYIKINKLKNPLNDAPDVAEALRKTGFDVIVRTNADKGGLDRALAEFARRAAGADAALFYYAGHGIQYQKQNFLLPTDIEVEDYNDVEFQAVNVNRVVDALQRSSGVKIVILDACRDNPLDKQLTPASRAAAGATRGLARVDRTEGMIFAYSTAADQVAQDGIGRNSPFTEALIRRLEEPGLEVGTLFRRVTQDVFVRTNGRQRPEIVISLLNDYYLNLNETDSRAWALIRDSSNPRDFEGFIDRFPNSPFARDAQVRLDLFERLRRSNEERQALERDRLVIEREREFREALERERLALAAERLAFERREAERREAEKLAAEKREAERLALLRELEHRKEAERLAAEKQEADRRDVVRLAEARREAERRVAQEQEAARAETERRASERHEAERREAERLAAEKRDEERLAAARREEARRQAERLAAEKKAEAERLAKEQADNARREAGRRTAEAEEPTKKAVAERETARKEAERLAAEKKEEAVRLANEEAEARRREAERRAAEKKSEEERIRLAALEQAEHKKSEQEAAKKRVAEACDRENDEVKAYAATRNKAALESFRKQALCPTIGVAVDKGLKDIAVLEARTCAVDKAALGKIGAKDLAGLRDALGNFSCSAVRDAAVKRVAKLDAEQSKLELVCNAESDKVTQAKTAGDTALEKLEALRKSITCNRLKAVVADAIKELEALAPKVAEIDTRRQILEAQTELKRMGCYAGNVSGNLNNGTKTAISKYFVAKNASVREVRIDDGLIDELKSGSPGICPAPPPANVAARPNSSSVEDDDEPVRPSRPNRRKAAVEKLAPKPVVRIERELPSRSSPKVAAPRPAAPPKPVASQSRPINMHGVGF